MKLSISDSVDAQNQRCSYVVFKVLAYGRTHGQSRDNQHFSDRWVTKFLKVWGSATK